MLLFNMIKLNGIDVSYAFLNSSSKTIRIHKKGIHSFQYGRNNLS